MADAPDVAPGGAAGRSTVYRQALRDLTGHQKTSKGAPAYSRYVNRPLGRRFAALAYALGRTPNQVTVLSAMASAVGIGLVALARPGIAVAVAVSLALVLGYALDAADGQLARLRGGGSVSGEWLDHVIDSVKIVSLHGAVLVAAYRDGRPGRVLLVPLGFLVVASVFFFTLILLDQLRRARMVATGAVGRAAPVRAPGLRSVLVLPTDYGLLCLVFLLFFRLELFLTVYGLMLLGTVLFLVAAMRSWFRELDAYSRPTPAAPAPPGTAVRRPVAEP